MEQAIQNLIHPPTRKECKERRELSPALQKKNSLIISKYPTVENFCEALNPSKQFGFCADEENCFTNDKFPTLNLLKEVYGNTAPVVWIVPQLFNISEFCGCKEKLSDMQLKELALLISQKYWFLKVSELMLFFFKFKSGEYGRFYGSVDPMVISEALLKFTSYRQSFLDKKRRMDEEKSIEADRQRETISYEEYCRRHNKTPQTLEKAAKTGNSKALDLDNCKLREIVEKSARDIVDNTNNLDDEYLAKMSEYFRRRYGMTPEHFLSTL